MPTPRDGRFQPPLYYRWLIRLAGLLVPRAARSSWRGRQDARLFDWWVLVERGELPRASDELSRLLRGAFADASAQRVRPEVILSMMRGPLFLLAAAGLVVLLAGAASRGFAYTRHLLALAEQLLPGPADLRSDVLAAHAYVLTLSLIIGLVTVFIRRPRSHYGGWLYWGFFAFKCAMVLVLLPVVWMEGAAAMRMLFPRNEGMRVLVSLLATLAYVPSLGVALAWVLSDQRSRCPVCLRRLDLPVTVGSWSSVFEPTSTEMLCDRGHGTLLLPETAGGTEERWTKFDDSWRDLFSHSAG